MLRGEELIVCQLNRTQLTRALAPKPFSLRPGRSLCYFAHSEDGVEETQRWVISYRIKTAHHFVEAKVARTTPG
jgi:hypothetical protein